MSRIVTLPNGNDVDLTVLVELYSWWFQPDKMKAVQEIFDGKMQTWRLAESQKEYLKTWATQHANANGDTVDKWFTVIIVGTARKLSVEPCVLLDYFDAQGHGAEVLLSPTAQTTQDLAALRKKVPCSL